MKKLLPLLLISICFFSCKDNSDHSKTSLSNQKITDSLFKIVQKNNDKYKNNVYKNVVHFGNSICKHPIIKDVWWGEWGMAATKPEYDYVHRFLSMLQAKTPNATSEAFNIAAWETNYSTFNKSTLDPYLIGKDLVVIRLGENVTYYPAFQNQYKILIQYIQSKVPNADILLGGQFWKNDEKENAMINVAIELGLPFVSLHHLDSAKYKQTIGGVVYGHDGNSHKIPNSGVANHPNNLGMLKIAESLYSVLTIKKN